MPHSLYGLIRASGYSGAASQSFRNNVTGAITGARMSDYDLYGIVSWASGDYTPGVDVLNNGTLTFTAAFDGGSRFLEIRQPGSAWFGVNTAESDPMAEILMDSVTYDAFTGITIVARFLGRFQGPGGGWSLVANDDGYDDFSGAYPSMEEPPDGNDYPYTVSLFPNGSFSLSYWPEEFDIIYPNDVGEFNPSYAYHIQVDVRARPSSPPSWEIQWSLDGSFTDLPGEDNIQSYHFMANKFMAPITINYRWRTAGSGPSWMATGGITAHFHN